MNLIQWKKVQNLLSLCYNGAAHVNWSIIGTTVVLSVYNIEDEIAVLYKINHKGETEIVYI